MLFLLCSIPSPPDGGYCPVPACALFPERLCTHCYTSPSIFETVPLTTRSYIYAYAERFSIIPQMDALRASVGLPPDPDGGMLFHYLYFICDPPQLRSAGMALPPTAHEVRLIFDRSGHETLPAWVSALPAGLSKVYATLGTALNHTPGLFEAILEDLRDEPLTLILTIGRDRDPAEFGPQPANVHIERYIPQSLILPLCDLVVSHCGSGTMRAALDAGLPMVNLPIAADQPENAARCETLGVSLTIGANESTPGAIRNAVRAVPLAHQPF